MVATMLFGTYQSARAGKPTIAAPCKQCHQPADDMVRGTMVGVSGQFKTIQVAAGSVVWVIKYGDDITLQGVARITDVPKEKEVAVRFTGNEKAPYAVSLSVKPVAKVAPEKLVSLEEMSRLVALGPVKGNFTLFDSRPAPKCIEGQIPGAVSLPLDKFDSLKDNLLPKDKNSLIIFYCGGMTCRLSPESARRAEALGYTNVKVFQEGMPAWKKAGNLVVSEPSYVKDLIARDIAHVLIDLRSPQEAQKGFIQGAVNIPHNDLAGAKERFPADKSAPVILSSAQDSAEAFKTVREWGYKETSVLRGGFEAWQQMGGKISTGSLSTVIAYAPKPRPGEISIEEFKLIAEKGAPDKIILDVRDTDEAMNGMLKGAMNIPAGKIKDRIAELPKDKEIITHCTTGIRAEMAYDDLLENGFKARFLNAVIQVDKDGKYEITKK